MNLKKLGRFIPLLIFSLIIAAAAVSAKPFYVNYQIDKTLKAPGRKAICLTHSYNVTVDKSTGKPTATFNSGHKFVLEDYRNSGASYILIVVDQNNAVRWTRLAKSKLDKIADTYTVPYPGCREGVSPR